MGRYDCFILRVWRSQGEGGEQWAARLEHVADAETLRFGDPEALLQYLRERIVPGGAANRPYRGATAAEGSMADEQHVETAES